MPSSAAMATASRKGDHPAFGELVVVGAERIGHQLLADVAVSRLVEVGVGGPEAREKREAARPVPSFLAELALGRRLGIFARLPATGNELVRVLLILAPLIPCFMLVSLCQRRLERPASESSGLCRGARAGDAAIAAGGR